MLLDKGCGYPECGECQFEFTVTLSKSEAFDDADDDERLVRGMGSCEDPDLQGEEVVQKGMDCSYLVTKGWVNWDHLPGPENLIGWPVKVEIAPADTHPVMAKSGVRGLAMYVEARLKKGLTRADATWFHLKNPTPSRPLAWSIQGKVTDRDGHRITKSQIRHLAITHQPIQAKSFAELAKSFANGDLAKALDLAAAQPTLLENLHGKLTSVLWGRCRKGCYDRKGQFRRGVRGALEHLTMCHEHPIGEAHRFLKALTESRVLRREEAA